MRTNRRLHGVLALASLAAVAMVMGGQAPPTVEPEVRAPILPRPDPKEIPLPVIKTDMKPMPGVEQ